MQEHYELLLGNYRDHPIIGIYLTGDEPAFEYLSTVMDMCSMEERVLIHIALSLHQDGRDATVQELLLLSDLNFERAIEAIKLRRR